MDEKNVRNIQKFLIAQLKFTPRRKLLEDHLLAQNSVEDENVENYDEIESGDTKTSSWKLIRELRDFRMSNARECMSQMRFRRFQRLKSTEKVTAVERGNSQGQSPPTTEELIALIENDKKTIDHRRRISSPPPLQPHAAFKFVPSSSLALNHQKFK